MPGKKNCRENSTCPSGRIMRAEMIGIFMFCIMLSVLLIYFKQSGIDQRYINFEKLLVF